MGVERFRIVPVPSTARRFTTVPSYTPLFPPTKTSSSITTGCAPTGSSTPPICALAEIWQFFPTCAQLPIRAFESTSVPSSTYAPTLIYIGGMQTTPLPIKLPSRMLEPPGTIRTPEVALIFFTGYVDLSKNGWRDASTHISTIAPIRNPRRMPFFTQGFTRQPDGEDASGCAARSSPSFSASLNFRNSRRSFSVNWLDG